MFLNVREMERRKVRFEETFPAGEIQFLEMKLSQAGPLTTAGTASDIRSPEPTDAEMTNPPKTDPCGDCP